ADVLDDTLILEALEYLDRSTRSHCGLERGVLRVVHEHHRQSIQPEQTQAALDGSLELLAAEVTGVQIAVCLGGKHITGRHAAELAEGQADAPLAFAVAVAGGRVDKPDRAAEGGPQRFAGALVRSTRYAAKTEPASRRL